MAQLSNKIKEYAKANGVSKVDFTNDVRLQDDSNGQGAYIKEWNLATPKPTLEQLNAYEAQANVVESNQAQVQNRIKEYGTIAQQIEYITENGLDAWQTKVNNIKAKYPKE
jgi:hypothetical protein